MSAVSYAPMNFIGPVLGAGLFVAIMSMVPDAARRSFNAIFAAGAVGAYIGGGFGKWELIYPLLATPVVYLGLRSYRAIGVAWLMHAAWDLPHQLTGHPIWPCVRTSSLGCMIFDSLIAVWFLAGAPIHHAHAKGGSAGRSRERSGMVIEQGLSGYGFLRFLRATSRNERRTGFSCCGAQAITRSMNAALLCQGMTFWASPH
jgi:Family of unknown function (DUF6010)